MTRGRSNRGRFAITAAIAALATCGASAAHGAVLKNDGFTTGGDSVCQLGFAAGESAAAAYAIPESDYPIRIDSLEVLGCDTAVNVNFQVFPDSLDSADPSGGALYTSPAPVSLAPGLQTFDISGAGTYVFSGGVRVAVTGATSGVKLARDDDGSISSERNMIFTEGAWGYSSDFGLTGDFVIRANYTSVSGVEITKKPKKTVKTKKRKALVKFKFGVDGSDFEYECNLDKDEFSDCSSPQLYQVGKGEHDFQVRAVSGSVTGDPAGYSFKVKRK